jgi:hypothetical protein
MAEKTPIEVDSQEAEITFQPDGRSGLVAVGTYLSEAANRFGIFHSEDLAEGVGDYHWVARVTTGLDLLSWPTQEEIDNLSEENRVKGERFAYQTKIERAGELVVEMVQTEKEKTEEELKQERFEAYQKEFGELPLGQKVSSLMQLEAITLGETFNFLLGLPYVIGDQVMGVLATFGKQMDEAAKTAGRPKEHAEPEAPKPEEEVKPDSE